MRLHISILNLGRIAALFGVLMTVPVSVADAQRGGSGGGDVLERLELRSVFSIGGRPQFSLRDPVRDLSFWIYLNETRHGIQVIEYSRETNQIVARYGDRTRRIGLSDAEIVPLGTQEQTDATTSGLRPAYGGVREEQRNPEERMQYILNTWDAHSRQNPNLRAIDEHISEYYQEFQDIRQRLWTTTDHDSAEFQRLRERRQELQEEMQVLVQLTQREVENIPDFEGIDRGAIIATLRYRTMNQPQQQRR
jgi:hypothetical protein